MTKAYVSYNSIVSSLGFDSKTVVEKVKNEISGLEVITDDSVLSSPFYSSLVPTNQLTKAFDDLNLEGEYTRLEQLMSVALSKVIKDSGIALTKRVGLIISTTKGNIDVLDDNSPFPKERAYLSELGSVLVKAFGFKNEAIVLSNACVSGILAVAIAKRYINQDIYDHVFVVGGDVLTEFIISGFNSFQALSTERCKPYCKGRVGINIGELSAAALVTSDDSQLPNEAVEIIGTGSCNDANHISGPSRTGEGLVRSIKSAFSEANIKAKEISYISAHGTATLYNDEMEAIAFNRLGLEKVPVNSLKGYFGHTLGASGLVEAIIGMHSLYQNTLFTSLGFEEMGVTQSIHIIEKPTKQPLQTFLKTASGFGGCNTAVVFKKVKQ